ncbi:division/cell wall cluster transcriptional repressor MraZ [Belliella sp. R4-6]|uniref:Transcriptional regulator MraZ n=1 Tax=Belliella alkalica TaxID=1730871 RepID=A0ABS9VAD6_9BACT|nr:division/cell wall cluster transcriptional repressor MraZ [Belliella alkalica]MCH7413396.1 division/cell wall cluster transcriptional repressor MraZ [Belliella alkalica]
MGMFNGQYVCKIDAKGRLALPAKLKAAIPSSNGNELYLRFGDEGCLALYTDQEFKSLYNQINGLSDRNELHRKIKRAFFNSLAVLEMDSAGRILIPKNFLEYAKIDSEVYIQAIGKFIELWNPNTFKNEIEMDPKELSALLDSTLGEL